MVEILIGLLAFVVSLLGLQKFKTGKAQKKADSYKAEADRATSENQAYKHKNELRKTADEIERDINTRSHRDERVRKYDRKS